MSKSDGLDESNSFCTALLRALEILGIVVPNSTAISLTSKCSRDRMQTLYCNFGSGLFTVMKLWKLLSCFLSTVNSSCHSISVQARGGIIFILLPVLTD